MNVNSKMTAIADEIRELSGTTGSMGLDAMANTLNTENANFSTNLTTQDNLISQIQTALQNKASASEPVLQTKTVTPTTSAQNVTPDSGYDGLNKVTVNAIPSTYVKPTTTKAATTYTPTTSNQTIAAGTYCSGVQTIKGDANLKAENIAEGVSIFGVTGTHSGGSSGGGSVETFTLTYEWVGPGDFMVANRTIYYTDKNLETKPVTPTTGTTCTVEVLKNSIVVITGGASYIVNGCQELGGGYGVYAYIITANNANMKGN